MGAKHCGKVRGQQPPPPPPPPNGNEDIVAIIAQVPVFGSLPPETMAAVARITTRIRYNAGDVVISQGDVGDAFFVIERGKASVMVNGNSVGVLSSGDHFGERALIREERRSSTVVAIAEVSCLKILATHFQSLELQNRLNFGQRAVVGAGRQDARIETKPPSPKTPEERTLMLQAVKLNRLLNAVLPLSDTQVDQIVDRAWRENVPAGKKVITEGDQQADFFYVVQEGTLNIQMQNGQLGGNFNDAPLSGGQKQIGKGSSFGELALICSAPRSASVTASVDSVLWVIDRKTFKDILAKSVEGIAKERSVYLDKVSVFDKLEYELKQQVAMALGEMHFSKGENVFTQGEEGDTFYIMIEGEVSVIEDVVESHKLTATPGKVEVFGERALVEKTQRSATITVVSDQATALTLDRASFDMLLSSHFGALLGSSVKRFGLFHLSDFETVGLLGCGGFGAVYLAEHKSTQHVYALKCMSKGYIVMGCMKEQVIRERDIQLMCNSHFVVELFETFSSDQDLMLLLELAIGGELYCIYKKKFLFGKPEYATFYAAGVAFAFDHLHGLKILYRDLKPENLLLTATGRIKLTDFGLSKVVVGKTMTACGTPDYFAPEMIDPTQNGGHNHAVDWWQLGVLIFELMTGVAPFTARSPETTFRKVMEGIDKVYFPAAAKGDVGDLVKALCKTHPAERSPMRVGGLQNIKDHPWFEGFDWDAMFNCTLQPPYNPDVRDPKAKLKDFSSNSRLPPSYQYKDDGTGWDKDFATRN